MLHELQVIYEGLRNPSRSSVIEVPVDQIARFLLDLKGQDNPVYQDFWTNIIKLKRQEISIMYIERFCLAKISEYILYKYPVNVAEAFVLAYITLNKIIDLHTLHFKLGASGLLAPTIIDGKRVENVEAIAQFIIRSLQEADLIKITENNSVIAGKNLKLEI